MRVRFRFVRFFRGVRMKMWAQLCSVALLLICMPFVAGMSGRNAYAGNILTEAPTDAEAKELIIKLGAGLPAYCGIKLAEREIGYVRAQPVPEFLVDLAIEWKSLLGRQYTHVHHYCWGLRTLIGTDTPGKDESIEEMQLKSALQEFNYFLSNVAPGDSLVPEALLNRAETYRRLGQLDKAIGDVEKCLQLSPAYTPAYVRLASYLSEGGRSVDAMRVLELAMANGADKETIASAMQRIKEAGAAEIGSE